MKVLLADEYGFCFGVERAVEMVEDSLKEKETVRTLGPLIHNDEEMQRLGKSGVTTISEPHSSHSYVMIVAFAIILPPFWIVIYSSLY